MAIEIINKMLLNGVNYIFDVPQWLKDLCLSHLTSNWSNEGKTSDQYNYYHGCQTSFPFKYYRQGGDYWPSNPQNVSIQSGVIGKYFHIINEYNPRVMELYLNNEKFTQSADGGGNTNGYNLWTYIFAVDKDLHKGYGWRILLGSGSSAPSSTNVYCEGTFFGINSSETFYNYLVNLMPIEYNFQSVTEIIGQGKYYILAQLTNSTDGNPVSGASSSAFDVLTNESLISSLLIESSGASSAGAGSGYIGNANLSNKKMVGHNVPTSDEESTKTLSVTTKNEIYKPDTPKIGDGHVRIKFKKEMYVLSNITTWTPDGDFGFTVTYDETTNENHIVGTTSRMWEYYECAIRVNRNSDYMLSLSFKGNLSNVFAVKECIRVFDQFFSNAVISANDGLYSSTMVEHKIIEGDSAFGNRSSYTTFTQAFNSGDNDLLWVYLGAGYIYNDTRLDFYFKDITLTEI